MSGSERGGEKPRAKPRDRRALSNVGGQSILQGDPRAAEVLAHALDVPTSTESEDASRAHVHGFHSYPARMHPVTARRVIEALSSSGDVVLDPFCGSGTVLVEARLMGCRAIGIDANPLAVRLAQIKACGTTEEERAVLVAAAKPIQALADERRKAKTGPTHRYGAADVALFDPHVLFELDSLRLGLDRVSDSVLRGDLELVLSAILMKVSRKASDTADRATPKRIAAGFTAKLFVRKAEELAARLAEVGDKLVAAPPLDVIEGDARSPAHVAAGSVDLVVTSPPYPGVYDYLAQHEDRLRWLRLRPALFEAAEIGARRKLEALGPNAGVAQWRDEIKATLTAIARALAPSGRAFILIADSVVAGSAVFADDMVRSLDAEVGLTTRAIASQERPHFHAPTASAFRDRPRCEHAIWLERASDAR